MNCMINKAGPFLILLASLTLVACGGDSNGAGANPVERNCQEFCNWDLSCLTDDGSSLPPGYGGEDVEGCINNCIEANEPIHNGFRECYDVLWEQNDCLMGISCEDYGSDDNIVENRCGAEIDHTERICGEGPGQ